MSQEGVERFLGRLLTDERLLLQATSSVAQAARTAGCLLSHTELQAIKPEDLVRITTVAAELDSGIKRFSQAEAVPQELKERDCAVS